MKWCFFVTPYPLLMEFLGKFASEVISRGDECILLVNGKVSEYTKLHYFPKEAKVYHKVDWLAKNYKETYIDFNGFSWKDVFPECTRYDLIKFSHKEIVDIISSNYQFIDFVFKNEKPDVILYGMPGSFFAEVAYWLCQRYNIKYLGLVSSRIGGRIDYCDLKYECSEYEKTFKKLEKSVISSEDIANAQKFLEEFISHKKLPAYMDYRPGSPVKNFLMEQKKMLFAWIRYHMSNNQMHAFDYESKIQFIQWVFHPWRFLERKYKAFFLNNVFDKPDNTDNFFLFPLHVQPELSTSGMATYFCDQLNTIKNVAFSLPFGFKLYVKEHPSAVGERKNGFYKTLKRNPNVVLIHPGANVENLIKASKGVITLTSTIGLEAVLLGKPVYALGTIIYSHHPLCYKVNSFDELKESIEKNLGKTSFVENLDEVNIRFILSYFKNTIKGNIISSIYKNDQNDYGQIYASIKTILLNHKLS